MVKIWENKRNDRYVFFARRAYESLPALVQSLKNTLLNHFEKSPGEAMLYYKYSSFGAVKKCW